MNYNRKKYLSHSPDDPHHQAHRQEEEVTSASKLVPKFVKTCFVPLVEVQEPEREHGVDEEVIKRALRVAKSDSKHFNELPARPETAFEKDLQEYQKGAMQIAEENQRKCEEAEIETKQVIDTEIATIESLKPKADKDKEREVKSCMKGIAESIQKLHEEQNDIISNQTLPTLMQSLLTSTDQSSSDLAACLHNLQSKVTSLAPYEFSEKYVLHGNIGIEESVIDHLQDIDERKEEYEVGEDEGSVQTVGEVFGEVEREFKSKVKTQFQEIMDNLKEIKCETTDVYALEHEGGEEENKKQKGHSSSSNDANHSGGWDHLDNELNQEENKEGAIISGSNQSDNSKMRSKYLQIKDSSDEDSDNDHEKNEDNTEKKHGLRPNPNEIEDSEQNEGIDLMLIREKETSKPAEGDLEKQFYPERQNEHDQNEVLSDENRQTENVAPAEVLVPIISSETKSILENQYAQILKEIDELKTTSSDVEDVAEIHSLLDSMSQSKLGSSSKVRREETKRDPEMLFKLIVNYIGIANMAHQAARSIHNQMVFLKSQQEGDVIYNGVEAENCIRSLYNGLSDFRKIIRDAKPKYEEYETIGINGILVSELLKETYDKMTKARKVRDKMIAVDVKELIGQKVNKLAKQLHTLKCSVLDCFISLNKYFNFIQFKYQIREAYPDSQGKHFIPSFENTDKILYDLSSGEFRASLKVALKKTDQSSEETKDASMPNDEVLKIKECVSTKSEQIHKLRTKIEVLEQSVNIFHKSIDQNVLQAKMPKASSPKPSNRELNQSVPSLGLESPLSSSITKEHEVKEAKQEIKEACQEVKEAKQEEKEPEQQEKVAMLEQKVTGLEAKVAEMTIGNVELGKNVREQQEKVRESEEESRGLRTQVQELTTKNEELNRDILKLTEEKEKAEEEIEQAEKEKKKNSGLLGWFESDSSKKDSQIKELKKDLKDKENELQWMQDEFEKKEKSLKQSIGELENALNDCQNNLNAEKDKVIKKSKDIEEKEERLNKVFEHIDEVQKAIKKKEKSINSSFKSHMEELRRVVLEKLEHQIKEKNAMENELINYSNFYERAKHNLEKACDHLKVQNTQNKDKDKIITKVHKTIGKHQELIQKQKDEMLKTIKKEAQITVAKMQSYQESSQKDFDSYKNDLKTKVSAIKTGETKAALTIEKLEQEIRDYRSSFKLSEEQKEQMETSRDNVIKKTLLQFNHKQLLKQADKQIKELQEKQEVLDRSIETKKAQTHQSIKHLKCKIDLRTGDFNEVLHSGVILPSSQNLRDFDPSFGDSFQNDPVLMSACENYVQEHSRLREGFATVLPTNNPNRAKVICASNVIWNPHAQEHPVEERLLKKTLVDALDKVLDHKLRSVAILPFCNAQSGLPKSEYAEIVLKTLKVYINENQEDINEMGGIKFAIYTGEGDYDCSRKLLKVLKEFDQIEETDPDTDIDIESEPEEHVAMDVPSRKKKARKQRNKDTEPANASDNEEEEEFYDCASDERQLGQYQEQQEAIEERKNEAKSENEEPEILEQCANCGGRNKVKTDTEKDDFQDWCAECYDKRREERKAKKKNKKSMKEKE